MILSEYVLSVKTLIRHAAELRKSVLFSELHSKFPERTPPANVYDTLEAACAELALWSEAIYSVVLAKKSTGLPGDGFFDIFRNHQSEEYKAIAGDIGPLHLTQDQREKMVALEKSRVYAHAMP
jgi:hypothetical protein